VGPPAARGLGRVTLTPSELTALLARHGIRPSQALGQNFVVDPNTVRRIARLAGVHEGDHVVEVGAGVGSLTLALSETCAAITAIEKDRRLVPLLRELTEPRGVRVIEADAMRVDWDEVLELADRWQLVANLPYNVGTPLVADLLETVPKIDRMLVMLQTEVAERLTASANSAAYGALSVKVAYWADAAIVGTVSPNVFFPRPKVSSSLVRITRRPLPDDLASVPRAVLFEVVRRGFAQRRKTLRRALAGDPRVDESVYTEAGVSPTLRAEALGLRDWARLAASIARRSGEAPA